MSRSLREASRAGSTSSGWWELFCEGGGQSRRPLDAEERMRKIRTHSLVVMKISERGIPDFLMAAPTAGSVP